MRRWRRKQDSGVVAPRLYELRISLKGIDHYFYVDHDLAALPEIETVKALIDEAETSFRFLYGLDPSERLVSLVRTSEQEPALVRNNTHA